MLDAIFNLLGSIANVIINGICEVVLLILNTILYPVDSFISSIAPDFGSLLINISRLFSVILGGPVSYFMSILNNFPHLKTAIAVSISFDIIFFSMIGVYYLIQGTISVVSKVRSMIH